MTLNHLKHRMKHLDDKYPWSMHPNITQRLLPKPGPSTAKDTFTTPRKPTTDKPPTPPLRPDHTKVEMIPLEELPSSKSLEYAVKKLETKGFDVKATELFYQNIFILELLPKRDTSKLKLALLR